MTLKDYEIFWDNGQYVAVRTAPNGSRMNVAPYNCQTKKEALAAAREDRDELNEENSPPLYQLETRAADGDTWTADGLGNDNEFTSREDAQTAIQALRELGLDWAAQQYRVTEIN